jgi:hypothetical protein
MMTANVAKTDITSLDMFFDKQIWSVAFTCDKKSQVHSFLECSDYLPKKRVLGTGLASNSCAQRLIVPARRRADFQLFTLWSLDEFHFIVRDHSDRDQDLVLAKMRRSQQSFGKSSSQQACHDS